MVPCAGEGRYSVVSNDGEPGYLSVPSGGETGYSVVTVRYHCGGWSEELNSRILLLAYMVYL